MSLTVRMRQDYSSKELRRLASRSKDANQSRRLLSLAAVLDGMSRADAARMGGMDRQTLRDWVHRFNAGGPDGLFDHWSAGPPSRLSEEQKAELVEIVQAGPNLAVDGVVRWRRMTCSGSSKSGSASTIMSVMSVRFSRSWDSRT
jgi:transposase-like protein